MVKFLFYKEETQHSEFPWMDKWLNFFGVIPIVIDREGPYSKKNPTDYFLYKTLQEAIDDTAHKNDLWVWLDRDGNDFLDEFEHPKDNVVYCIGSDFDGFQEIEFFGKVLKIRPPTEAADGEWYAYMALPLVLYDRYLRVK